MTDMIKKINLSEKISGSLQIDALLVLDIKEHECFTDRNVSNEYGAAAWRLKMRSRFGSAWMSVYKTDYIIPGYPTLPATVSETYQRPAKEPDTFSR